MGAFLRPGLYYRLINGLYYRLINGLYYRLINGLYLKPWEQKIHRFALIP